MLINYHTFATTVINDILSAISYMRFMMMEVDHKYLQNVEKNLDKNYGYKCRSCLACKAHIWTWSDFSSLADNYFHDLLLFKIFNLENQFFFVFHWIGKIIANSKLVNVSFFSYFEWSVEDWVGPLVATKEVNIHTYIIYQLMRFQQQQN